MSNVVPEGWAPCELGALSSKIEGGGTPSRLKPEFWGSEIPWATVKDLKSVRLANTQEFITSRGLSSSSSKLIPAFTPILASRMAVGKVVVFDKPVAINQDLKAFYPTPDLNWEYFVHWYISMADYIEGLSTGSTVKGIRLDDLKVLPVDLPPLPEQKKIAAILTSVDEVIEKTQAQIDKLKDLKTGMMQELLTCGVGVGGKPHTEFKDSPVGRIPKGWEVKALGDIFTLKNGVNKGKEFFGTGVPIISYRNVFDGNGIYDHMLSNKVEMTESELSRFKVEKGDLFITRTSETPDEIGLTNVYLGDLDNVVYNGFVIRARQKSIILDFDYCKYAFKANYMRQQMIHSSKFTTRAGISGESLELLKVIVPALSEQKKIGKALSAIDARILTMSIKIESQKSLKKALMQDLLTGKVRVKVD